MIDKEALEILGLKPGAGTEEINRAHRDLMQKLHPDQGGSSYLTDQVEAARATLLGEQAPAKLPAAMSEAGPRAAVSADGRSPAFSATTATIGGCSSAATCW